MNDTLPVPTAAASPSPAAPTPVAPPPPAPAGPSPAEANPGAPADPQQSTINHQPALFPRHPDEPPRAFSAFMTFFQLGHARSLGAVADRLGEALPNVKRWSSKYGWSERLLTFNSGVLQQQALDQAAR